MGQCSPHEQPLEACLGLTITQGIAAIWGGASVFTVGVAVGAEVGGMVNFFWFQTNFLRCTLH